MKKNGVICAIDVNDFDQNTIDLAATFAKQFQCDLDLVHVTIFPNASPMVWPGYVGSPSLLKEENLRFRDVTTNVADVETRHHHLSGLPDKEILRFAKEHEPRLLVLGTHGRRGLSRILGSISTAVLRRAACPVLIIRQRQRDESPSPQEQESLG